MFKVYSVTEKELIRKCKEGNETARKFLYDKYKSVLMGISMRYMKNPTLAEEVLIETFMKIFTKIDQYDERGSFEGWIKKICVNEALMHLRKQKKTQTDISEDEIDIISPAMVEDSMMEHEILKLLDALPEGYRTVFNLYVIEGYKHKEIAEMLGISINTSKSQLIMARKRLRELLEKINYPGLSKYM